jgi:HAD superfamily hydrolase (TIGR01509 family)
MAGSFGVSLTAEDGERLEGVGRLDALRVVLDLAGVVVPPEDEVSLAARKNARYLELVRGLGPSDVLPGARSFLECLRDRSVPTALGSASRDARVMLGRLDLAPLFDAVVDGTVVHEAKPHPRVFLAAAERVRVDPFRRAGFEDAQAGIEAAVAAGMTAIGVDDLRDHSMKTGAVHQHVQRTASAGRELAHRGCSSPPSPDAGDLAVSPGAGSAGEGRRDVDAGGRHADRAWAGPAGRPSGSGRAAPRFSTSGAKPRSRRLLVTTNTELNAIAAPAIIGFSSPATASGIAATL